MDQGKRKLEIRFSLFQQSALHLTILVALGIATPLYAQYAENIAFERFSTPQGLSNYTITSILQDKRGFLWIGTQGGLNRFDGYTFIKYTAGNSVLSNDWINALYEDHLGMLWIGTQEAGVYTFDPGTEQFTGYAFDPEDPGSLSHNGVKAIFEDQAGQVWIGTARGGLNRFDRATGHFAHYRSGSGGTDGLASDVVWAINAVPSEPGVLWVGTEGGLNRLDLRTQPATITLHDPGGGEGLLHDVVRSIYADQSGELWVGTQNNGVYAFHPGIGSSRRWYSHDSENPNSLSSNYVLAIHVDLSGALWVGTYDGGLNRLEGDTERFTRYGNDASDPGSLPHDQVQAILMDRTGVLWVGTWGGLGKLSHRLFTSFTHVPEDRNSLSHSNIGSIYEDESGMLWVGTQGGGLNRLDRRTGDVKRYSLEFEDIMAVCVDQSGSIWLGTRDNNLYRFDRETEEVSTFSLDPSGSKDGNDIIVTIYEPPSQPGTLWIGTKLKGIYTFDVRSHEIKQYLHDTTDTTSLSNNYAWPIYEDASEVIWVGTWGGGLNRFNRETEKFTPYLHDDDNPHSISDDQVISIREDRQGVLWAGTFRGGLNRLDRSTGRFTRYTERDGLPSNDILGILADDEGYLWLSTNNGLSRFDPRTVAFVNYGIADGLLSGSFRIGASHKNKQGELFFGGDNGILVIRTEGIGFNPYPPQVVLTGLKLFNEPVGIGPDSLLQEALSETEVLTLRHNQNDLSLAYVGLHYSNPARNQYAYRLDPYHDDWQNVGTERAASFTNLDPGNYVFRVKAANADGKWNEEGATLDITILRPWWQAWWAYVFYAAFLVSIVLGGYKWRLRRLEKHALELTQMVEERTRDLQAEKRKTEEQAERLLELQQVKDRFFANISHEFRTPLHLILAPVHDALDGAYGSVPPRLYTQLGVMRRNGEHLKLLITQLLDIAKIEEDRMPLHARERDLVPFVKEIVLSFSALAERRRVTLKYHPEVDRLPLYFDAVKLQQVITNLLSNAFKFTPEHGKVWLTVETGTGDAGEFAEIIVRDTGQGIPADERSHIFDLFHQVDSSMTREHEGTGIGLTLAKQLVELHQGTIEVESEEGFGSTFTVRLPLGKDHLGQDDLVDDPAEVDVTTEPSETVPGSLPDELDVDDDFEPPGASAPRILVVEDNADVRAYLKDRLASLYHVVEAGDGVEGLDRAREAVPDLVISDVMMPRMDGIALCRALRQDAHLKHIPVILLTAKVDAEIEGLASGADDYIVKPFKARVLLARVENLIKIRRMITGHVRIGPSEIVVPSEEATFVEQVRGVVEAHMGDSNFNVDWLADLVGMGRRQLHRRLQKSADLSPGGFIRKMRLERASQLLEQRAGSVAEIAYRVGFKNADHFSRAFRRVFGVPPTQYPTE